MLKEGASRFRKKGGMCQMLPKRTSFLVQILVCKTVSAYILKYITFIKTILHVSTFVNCLCSEPLFASLGLTAPSKTNLREYLFPSVSYFQNGPLLRRTAIACRDNGEGLSRIKGHWGLTGKLNEGLVRRNFGERMRRRNTDLAYLPTVPMYSIGNRWPRHIRCVIHYTYDPSISAEKHCSSPALRYAMGISEASPE